MAFDYISDFTVVTRPGIEILRLFQLFKLFSIIIIALYFPNILDYERLYLYF